ncbi:MAG: 30S ribosomal protein S4e [Candidatus Heimdallarchaeum endolithica]|uniref:Small ribosomal subunit protein eS4 n=1 Tax=Candidatus Heimdallarchaeum endolithica TaxID=2876572 RepID=A0A9Y1BNU4_9ARCH|nr:MAG: 30S ribosomal protein S4e [Candidatus Heimdallarchaeum endolithica]
MTKSGGKKHLKRLVVSEHYPIHKKEYTFSVRPSPGPHAADVCIPTAIILRDLLKYARNISEVKKIIYERNVLVDGRVRLNRKYPVGFMDVFSLPKINEHYRMLYKPKIGLRLVPIDEEKAKVKFCQIVNKTTLKGGKTQLNLHDGRNIILSEDDYKIAAEYTTHATVKISIPEQKILDKFDLEVGNYGLIISGRGMGQHGIIENISTHGTSKTKTATIRTTSGTTIETLYRYIFVIGKDTPDQDVGLPEVDN